MLLGQKMLSVSVLILDQITTYGRVRPVKGVSYGIHRHSLLSHGVCQESVFCLGILLFFVHSAQPRQADAP